MSIKITDIDFRTIMNDWSREDIMYLRSLCEEKLISTSTGILRRRAVVRGHG
jgi:hypothetical protein